MSDLRQQFADKIMSDITSHKAKIQEHWFSLVMHRFYPDLIQEEAAKNFTRLIHPDELYQLQLNGMVVSELRIKIELTHDDQFINASVMSMVGA